jgi:hypothetical protein
MPALLMALVAFCLASSSPAPHWVSQTAGSHQSTMDTADHVRQTAAGGEVWSESVPIAVGPPTALVLPESSGDVVATRVLTEPASPPTRQPLPAISAGIGLRR